MLLINNQEVEKLFTMKNCLAALEDGYDDLLKGDAVYRPRCAGQSFFSRTDAKGRLLDSSIRVRDGLLKQPEVLASPKLRRVVRRSLADARFERAYFAYQMGGKFRWKDYLASCAMGVAWRHVSLLAKVLARSVSRKSATSTRS